MSTPCSGRSVVADTLAALERTPPVLDALLRGTAPASHDAREGPGSWSAREVIGHLIHAEETSWVPRTRVILEEGGRRPFEPFDRYAHLERFAEWRVDDLLDRFAALRASNLETVRRWALTDERLSRRGLHPELGSVTLRQLLAAWMVHDLGHLAQAARAMARRHAHEVGPWREYLSVLRP